MKRWLWIAITVLMTTLPVMAEESYSVPLTESYSGGRYIRANIDGIEVNFIFDTGCSSLFINQSVFNELLRRGIVKRKDLSKANEAELANGQSHAVRHFNIKRMQIGDCVLHDIQASVGIGDQPNATCLFGQAVLERFAYYSIAGNKIYFEPKPEAEQQALVIANQLSEDTARAQQQRIVEALQPYADWLSPRYLVIYAYALYHTDQYEQAMAIFRYLLDSGEFEDSDRQLEKALEKVL